MWSEDSVNNRMSPVGGPFGGGDVGDKFYMRFFHLYPSNTNPTENCGMIEWKA